MTDPIEERLARYIAEYEDAPNWGGPTRYPDPPSIADLKVILSRIAEVERLEAALRDAKLQLEYLDGKFAATGTTSAVLARIDAALSQHRKL